MATLGNPRISSVAEATIQLPIRTGIRTKRRYDLVLLLVVGAYLFAWSHTGAHFMADTSIYKQAILHHEYNTATVDYRSSTSNPFWDFGHLLWRPFGWLCFAVSKSITQEVTHHNLQAEVLVTLIAINFVAALATVSLFFVLSRQLIGSVKAAVFATIGFFSADAF
jgi:hypothetical protein